MGANMKLLVVDCCMSLREQSRTQLLLKTFLKSWKEKNPTAEIETVDLKNMDIKPLDVDGVKARDAAVAAGKMDDPNLALAKQFADADRIVVAAPLWEMSFPSKLRVYIERISIPGISFKYTETGSEGLCKSEKMLHIVTAGGPFSQVSAGKEYLENMSAFYGINQIDFVGADMQDVEGFDYQSVLDKAAARATEMAKTF